MEVSNGESEKGATRVAPQVRGADNLHEAPIDDPVDEKRDGMTLV